MKQIADILKTYWSVLLSRHVANCEECAKGFGYCRDGKAMQAYLLPDTNG